MSDRYLQYPDDLVDGKFFVEAAKVPEMMEAALRIKSQLSNWEEIVADYRETWPEMTDFEILAHYYWYILSFDNDGNAVKIQMVGESSRFDWTGGPFLDAIAPFVQEGSVIYYRQESGMQARFKFKGGKYSLDIITPCYDGEEGEEE